MSTDFLLAAQLKINDEYLPRDFHLFTHRHLDNNRLLHYDEIIFHKHLRHDKHTI